MKKAFNARFDITGNELSRVMKTTSVARFFPLGNFGGGPGLKCMLVLMLVHYFGRPVFWLLTKHEDKLHRVYQKIRGRG